MAINNSQKTALELIRETRPNLFRRTVDHHISDDNKTLYNLETYKEFNLTPLLRNIETIGLASSIIHNILLPAYLKGEIPLEQIHKNLTHHIPDTERSINAVELLLLLETKLDHNNEDEKKNFSLDIERLCHTISSKFDMQPSNAFEVRLEQRYNSKNTIEL